MRFSRAITFLVPFIAFQCIQASGQQVVATWSDATGKWSNPANWSTLTVPNNGGGTTYDVVISVPNSSVTMNVRHVTIDNVTLATATSLNIKAGDSLSLVSGRSNNYAGTLTNYGTFNNSAGFINFSSSSVIDNHGILNNRGSILNTDGLNFINNGLVTNSGGIGNIEAALVNNNTLINTGALSANNGFITNNGTLVSSSTGSISLGEASF